MTDPVSFVLDLKSVGVAIHLENEPKEMFQMSVELSNYKV